MMTKQSCLTGRHGEPMAIVFQRYDTGEHVRHTHGPGARIAVLPHTHGLPRIAPPSRRYRARLQPDLALHVGRASRVMLDSWTANR